MLRDAALANLTTIFKNEATDTHDADKLVDLFRNRAELKKEFAALRNEKYELQDRVKHHQGATARVQQQLQHLENLLLDPEWVYNVVAFYQLRSLAMHCNKQLVRFAEELKQQREKRVHGVTNGTTHSFRCPLARMLDGQFATLATVTSGPSSDF